MDPSPWTFIFTIFNFVALVVGLTYLLFKPVRKIMNERKQRIEDGMFAVEEQKREAVELKRQAEASRVQAFDLVKQARDEGERVRQEKLAETKKELARLAERNRAELQAAQVRAIEEVRQEAADLVMAVAGKVLGETVDRAAHQRLIEQFLQDLAGHGAKGERWKS